MELQYKMLERQARDAFACMEDVRVDARQKAIQSHAFSMAAFESLICAIVNKWNDKRTGETA